MPQPEIYESAGVVLFFFWTREALCHRCRATPGGKGVGAVEHPRVGMRMLSRCAAMASCEYVLAN